jgi:hypothetical protein
MEIWRLKYAKIVGVLNIFLWDSFYNNMYSRTPFDS